MYGIYHVPGICIVYTIHMPCKIFIGVPDGRPGLETATFQKFCLRVPSSPASAAPTATPLAAGEAGAEGARGAAAGAAPRAVRRRDHLVQRGRGREAQLARLQYRRRYVLQPPAALARAGEGGVDWADGA